MHMGGPYGFRPTYTPDKVHDNIMSRLEAEPNPHVAAEKRGDGTWYIHNITETQLRDWEMGRRVATSDDTRNTLDIRLAEANYASTTFADFIGA